MTQSLASGEHPATSPMIEVHHVDKRYGDFLALSDVSLEIARGEVVGLLGPNGAGKTTLIRSLTGYFEPSAGHIRIDGHDVVEEPLLAQSSIGYLPEQTPLYPEMLVQEYLDMVADLRNVPPGDRRLRLLAEAVWATGLEGALTKPIAALSKGFRQRVGLAQAILHQPKVLILDEPTSGLDPSQVVHVRDLIRELAKTTTVLFSTHILSEVEQVCERAVILLGGQVQLDQRLEALRTTHRALVGIASDASTSAADAESKLRALSKVQGVRRLEARAGYHRFEVQGADDDDLCRRIYRLAREQSWELGELSPVTEDLETVFRRLVREHEEGLSRGTSSHTSSDTKSRNSHVLNNVHPLQEGRA